MGILFCGTVLVSLPLPYLVLCPMRLQVNGPWFVSLVDSVSHSAQGKVPFFGDLNSCLTSSETNICLFAVAKLLCMNWSMPKLWRLAEDGDWLNFTRVHKVVLRRMRDLLYLLRCAAACSSVGGESTTFWDPLQIRDRMSNWKAFSRMFLDKKVEIYWECVW